MSSVEVRSQSGDVVGEVTLEPAWFGAQVNVPVMHQVVVAQMAARRAGTHETKTRADVSGGGRKPFRQKGTGRARQGSTRAPHWVGGGVVFGPHTRDHSVKVPRKMRAAALRGALSDRASEGRVAVIDSLAFDVPKTKEAAAALSAAGAISGRVLLVLAEPDDAVWRSFRNLPRVHVITADQLNTYDVLARDWIVFTKGALELLNARGTAGVVTAEGGEA
ncbi:MAG: 50S ribosomal protein L4 [Actinomycetota bacterium]